MSSALLIIDVQNDFTPGGALGVPEGDAVIGHVNDLIASGRFDLVLATRDWHPEDHGSFQVEPCPQSRLDSTLRREAVDVDAVQHHIDAARRQPTCDEIGA